MKKNQTDLVSDAVAAAIEGYAPDYVAPVLVNKLVATAVKIGLSEENVVDSVRKLFDLHRTFAAGRLKSDENV